MFRDIYQTTQLSDAVQLVTGDDPTLVTVGIDDPYGEGNRETDLPTIVIESGPDGINWRLRMTWAEARELASAITQVVDVAQNG